MSKRLARVLAFLTLSLATGCHGSGATSTGDGGDLGVDGAASSDLASVADLATSRADLLAPGYCPGSGIAGTCVQGYFAQVAACWKASGSCVKSEPDGGQAKAEDACWASGARFASTENPSTMGAHGVWSAQNGAVVCLDATVTSGANDMPVFRFTTPEGVLVYDQGAGAVTCPDKTTVNIGGQFGDCPDLADLVNVPTDGCSTGACP